MEPLSLYVSAKPYVVVYFVYRDNRVVVVDFGGGVWFMLEGFFGGEVVGCGNFHQEILWLREHGKGEKDSQNATNGRAMREICRFSDGYVTKNVNIASIPLNN